MTPAARVAAAIDILDDIFGGATAERAISTWARGARYAGSKDRAAIRDHVFSGLRCRRSFAWRGGAETGRAVMIGEALAKGQDLGAIFTGEGHAPPVIAPDEVPGDIAKAPQGVALDLPDWLLAPLEQALGADLAAVAREMQQRAPLFLRANLAKTPRDAAIAALASEGIAARAHPLAQTAIEVTENPRKVAQSAAYKDGLVEPQDASSQAVCAQLPQAGRALDYCAGGGGKALALGAQGCEVYAHDANPRRMRDLPDRAERAGLRIPILATDALPSAGPFDLVLCDVPCSGSGSWRRDPEGKWALQPDGLDQLLATQQEILTKAAELVGPSGVLAYATCSLLHSENAHQITRFLGQNPSWQLQMQKTFTPLSGGDGFFVALLNLTGKSPL